MLRAMLHPLVWRNGGEVGGGEGEKERRLKYYSILTGVAGWYKHIGHLLGAV